MESACAEAEYTGRLMLMTLTSTLMADTVAERRLKLEKERFAAYQTMHHGLPPMNPFKSLRTEFLPRLPDWPSTVSHQFLADRILISKLALIRAEQGAYDAPLPTLVDYYVNNHDQSELFLRESYEHFQQCMRMRNALYFGGSLELLNTAKGADHPFRQLRKNRSKSIQGEVLHLPVGINEVSRDLCLAQSTLAYFEKRWRIQKSVPKSLQQALRDCGYGIKDVDLFNRTYIRWREANK